MKKQNTTVQVQRCEIMQSKVNRHNQCSTGMSHTLEYFAFDDTDVNPEPAMNGSIPLTKDGDNNTEIYFCHYKPVDCGEIFNLFGIINVIIELCNIQKTWR